MTVPPESATSSGDEEHDDLGWPTCPRCLVMLTVSKPMRCPGYGLVVL